MPIHAARMRSKLIFLLIALVVGPTGFASAPTIDAAGSYSLFYSTSSNRSNPASLDGQTVSGKIYVFTSPDDGSIVRVRFYLDNPLMTGSPRRTETTAPYDFAGGSVSSATAFNVSNLSSGSHTITAAIDLTGGTTTVLHATFTVGGTSGSGTSTALQFDAPSLVIPVPLHGEPVSRTVTLTTDTGSSTSFAISDSVGWATVSRSSTSTTSTITVTVFPDELAAGSYNGTVTATASNHTPAVLPIVLAIPGPGPDQVHLAWVGDPSTTITVVWRTQDQADPSIVSFRRAGTTAWQNVTGSLRPSGTQGTLHEVHLTSLTPSTEYEYRVSGPGNSWSEVFTTSTAPPPGPADFDLIYVADTGIVGRDDGLASGTQQVIDAIANMNPLVVLGGGDYGYFDHDKRFNTLDNTIDAWFNQMQPIASQSPLMPTYGNHEAGLGENYESWAARFPTPAGTDNRQTYSFDIGDVHFVSIYAVKNTGGLTQTTRNWIVQDIQAAKARGQRWIIPYLHVAPFSEGTNHPSNLKLRSQLGPIFESLGVQVVITSHDQSYERTYPLVDVPSTNTPTSLSRSCYTMNDGVTWVKVSPGGKRSNISKDFSPWNSEVVPAWTAFRDNTMHHFLRVQVSADGVLRVEAFGLTGDGSPAVIQDSFEYTTGTCVPSEPGDENPPEIPTGLTATGTQNGVSLDWANNSETDLAGYHVYRSATETGAYSRLTTTQIPGSAFVDTSALAGTEYFYRVTALDGSGNESQPSSSASGTRLATNLAVVYSLTTNRANPVTLAGATVSGKLCIFTTPDTPDIVQVRFFLDDPAMLGSPLRTEGTAPYDFIGGSVTTAKVFDTNTIVNGSHTITAAVDFANGTTQTIAATFVVANGTTMP